MRRHLLLIVAICVGLLVSLASAAHAQDTNAPPGNSGVDQYLETVPEAGGNRPARDRKDASRLSTRTSERLKAAGADGEAVANLVASTGGRGDVSGSRRSTKSRKQGGKSGSGASDQRSSRPSAGVPGNVAAPVLGGSGSGGMGIVLPLLLALSAIGATVFALRRRRRG